MKVKLILPALTEAESPFWRPIKYSLFPPLGLATLAGYLSTEDDIEIIDQHVESLNIEDQPDLVIIQVYITNAYRSYQIADYYRKKNVFVALGGLHVTSLPLEALPHADAIFLGPGEDTFPHFLSDFRIKKTKKVYQSSIRSLENMPKVRRDLIKRHNYLVPNSIVVTRGCPHHCDFCYKDAFFNSALIYIEKDSLDKALELLNITTEITAIYPKAYYYRGYIFERKKDYESARKNYQQAASMSPSYKEAQEAVDRLKKLK